MIWWANSRGCPTIGHPQSQYDDGKVAMYTKNNYKLKNTGAHAHEQCVQLQTYVPTKNRNISKQWHVIVGYRVSMSRRELF